MSVHMNSFKLGDNLIGAEPLRPPAEGYDFVSSLKTKYKSVVREQDLLRFEENFRKSLVLLSNADAAMAAILFEYPTGYDPDDMMMRALTRVTQVLQGLVDLNLANPHQVVTHRRDTALDARLNNDVKPVKIEESHLVSLRSGPMLGEVDLFDQALLRQVKQERDSKRADQLHTAALSKLAYSTPNPARPPKRKFPPPSATMSVPPERQQKQARRATTTPQPQQAARSGANQQQSQFPSGGPGLQQPYR